MREKIEEICPVCAEKGITEQRRVRIEKIGDKITKHYSPCGHKHVTVFVEDKITATDEVKVDKKIVVTEEISLKDFVTVTGSTISTLNAIMKIRDMLVSVASQYDQKWASFIQLIINQLNTAIEIAKKQEIEFTLAHKSGLDKYAKKIEEYKMLIDKGAEEPEFQNFFEQNLTFLDPKVKNAFSKKSFGGEGFPDFLLTLHDSSYLLVEIEKPRFRLFTKEGDPTSELSHAQRQIMDYLRWANEEKEFLRKRGCPNISADNTKGLVVIGVSSNLTDDESRKLEGINATVRSRYEIKTFDKILEENEGLLTNLRNIAEGRK